MRSVKQRQLSFAFADNSVQAESGPQRVSGEPDAKKWLLHIAKDKKPEGLTTEAADASRLLEAVASVRNMAKALRQVVRNKGAAGTDGQSVEEVVQNVRLLLPKLRHALLTGTYIPGDVRRVWIPKPDGGQRGLGIPNVIDRWVQQAVFQVLESIWEPTFHDSSHGFRPNRSAHTAIAQAKEYVAEGRNVVVDLDLSKFFDRVNHQRLLNRLYQRVKDERILKLIHRMLKAKVVMPDGARVSTEEGTPQGGPLSPLLSNIVLDELDKELERRGLSFVRYADDCNIYVRSERAGLRVMDSIRKFIEKRLRLKVNDEKSSVTNPSKAHFLGFRLTRRPDGGVEVQLSDRSCKRIRERIRELTPRMWGQSLDACFDRLNAYLRGWGEYFRICTSAETERFAYYDGHIRRRVRTIIIRQKRRNRYLYRDFISRGVKRKLAAVCAYSHEGHWHKSKSNAMHRAYGLAWFKVRLFALADLLKPITVEETGSGQQLLLFG